jgi:hypothetical protein
LDHNSFTHLGKTNQSKIDGDGGDSLDEIILAHDKVGVELYDIEMLHKKLGKNSNPPPLHPPV